MKLELKKNLNQIKNNSKNLIDYKIGEIRKYFITYIPGQDMVYQEKRIEAEMLINNPSIELEKIPHIVTEAEMNGISILDQANIIIAQYITWRNTSSVLERIRLEKKQQVEEAISERQINSIVESIDTEIKEII